MPDAPATRIDPADLPALLSGLPHWHHDTARGGLIRRDFAFGDFASAFGFMAQMALVSERLDHHPEWSNVYDQVSVTLTTHDAGGLTAHDIAWARQADRVHAALAAAGAPK